MAGFDPIIQSISAKTGAEANLAFACFCSSFCTNALETWVHVCLWKPTDTVSKCQYVDVLVAWISCEKCLWLNELIRAYSDYRIPSINDSLAIRDLIFEVRLNRVSLVRYIGLFWKSNMHMHIHYFTKQSIVKWNILKTVFHVGVEPISQFVC